MGDTAIRTKEGRRSGQERRPGLLTGVSGFTLRIEFGPACLAVDAASRDSIQAATIVQNGLDPRAIRIGRLDADERAAAANALGIDVSVFVAVAGFLERAEKTAGRAAGRRAHRGADGGRRQPTRRHHRPQARDRQHAQAGQNADAGAEGAARSRTLAGPFADVIDAVAIPVAQGGAGMVLVLMTIMPFFRIVGDNADGRMIKAGGLEFRDGGQGLVVVEGSATRNGGADDALVVDGHLGLDAVLRGGCAPHAVGALAERPDEGVALFLDRCAGLPFGEGVGAGREGLLAARIDGWIAPIKSAFRS
uniref:Ubiquitin-like domain-containing protein n=1 Tax=Parastrongyloides trichosuri TaxID=131310 RepID=A0A0N4ZXW4_PARTI